MLLNNGYIKTTRIMDPRHIVVNPNATFLLLYQQYIKNSWKRQYFHYDALKAEYKLLKDADGEGLDHYEHIFYDEIYRVYSFLGEVLKDVEEDLDNLKDACKSSSDENNKKFNQAIELSVRDIYHRCKDCRVFYRLNKYVINKIVKKYEKLIVKYNNAHGECGTWENYPSSKLFENKFLGTESKINEVTAKSVELYCSYFRQTHLDLAEDELEFVKNKTDVHKETKAYIGLKIGLIICLMIWLLADANIVENNLDFWNQAGLFVYTTAGNLLLFRITWATNIFLWDRFSVNYIPLFGFHSLKSNLLQVTNQTATLLLIYCISLMMFFRANSTDTLLSRFPFLKYGCPLLLIVWSLGYEIYDYSTFSVSMSRGLFTRQVVYNCLSAPFAILSFRDIYAADVLTSFTKVIADSVYSSCWLLSGSFLQTHSSSISDFGSSYMHCTGKNMVIAVGCFQCLPLIIRMLQCFRQYYDSGYTVTFPFLFNALKYILSIVVVVYGLTLNGATLQVPYLVIIVGTTLYKWWWDCVMDWGLCDTMPSLISCCNSRSGADAKGNEVISKALLTGSSPLKKTKSISWKPGHYFLRPLLMYKRASVYYLCILLDLVLRFLWVVSLVPQGMFGSFVGPQLSFFLGSMEILRRAMWGLFRVEYEHLKHVTKGTPGFLDHHHQLERRDRARTFSVESATAASNLDRVRKLSRELFEEGASAGLGGVEQRPVITSMPENNDAYFKREGLLHRSKGLSNLVVSGSLSEGEGGRGGISHDNTA